MEGFGIDKLIPYVLTFSLAVIILGIYLLVFNGFQLQTASTSTSYSNGITAYIPITLTNKQVNALSANTPINITFNALAYQAYETPTLNNLLFYYANGTAIKSWMEGNILNETQQANTLYTSNTVLFWVETPSSNVFLPANTGTATTNTIYLGFKIGQTWNSVTGVAPQLTCATPANTAVCASGNAVSGTYGQFDNGNNIFSFYDNFTGTSLQSSWSNAGAPYAAPVNVVANGLSLYTPTLHLNYGIVNTYSANSAVSPVSTDMLMQFGAQTNGGFSYSVNTLNINGEQAEWGVGSFMWWTIFLQGTHTANSVSPIPLVGQSFTIDYYANKNGGNNAQIGAVDYATTNLITSNTQQGGGNLVLF
ncbi:MAG TPA: hypothetical protein VNZ45_17190, partial [Bacteroidia bacterium]|nr:hypothetical protein [Bacteroidia bacterium]